MRGEHGGNGGTGEKSMLGKMRGFNDRESVVGSENGGLVRGRSEVAEN